MGQCGPFGLVVAADRDGANSYDGHKVETTTAPRFLHSD